MKPDKVDERNIQLNKESEKSAVSKAALLMDSVNTKKHTFNELINIISIVRSCSWEQALTEFSDLNTIYGMDTASEMVNNMKKDYLKQKKFNPYIDSDGRYRGYVYYEDKDGKRKRKAISATDLLTLTTKAVEFYRVKDPLISSKPMTFKDMFPLFMRNQQ